MYIIPSAAIFILFLFYPFFKTIFLSLFLTNNMGQPAVFVGLGNYIDLLTSSSFYNSIRVTAVFVVIEVVLSMMLGLLAAVLCSKTFSGH